MLLEAVGSKRGIKDDLEGDSRVQLVRTLVVRRGEAMEGLRLVCGWAGAGLGYGRAFKRESDLLQISASEYGLAIHSAELR